MHAKFFWCLGIIAKLFALPQIFEFWVFKTEFWGHISVWIGGKPWNVKFGSIYGWFNGWTRFDKIGRFEWTGNGSSCRARAVKLWVNTWLGWVKARIRTWINARTSWVEVRVGIKSKWIMRIWDRVNIGSGQIVWNEQGCGSVFNMWLQLLLCSSSTFGVRVVHMPATLCKPLTVSWDFNPFRRRNLVFLDSMNSSWRLENLWYGKFNWFKLKRDEFFSSNFLTLKYLLCIYNLSLIPLHHDIWKCAHYDHLKT